MTDLSAFPENWWQEFFESPDSIPLSFFPSEKETDAEIAGLLEMLALRGPERVADICCGGGRHVLRLRAQGYQVVGLDISRMMLLRAQREAGRRACPLVRGDARYLPFRSGSLEVVLNLFNSFGYCETDAENEAVFQEAARCLAPGGQFLLETRNPQYQILFAPVRQTVAASRGRKLVVGWRYDRETHRLSSEWRSGSNLEEVVYRASLRLYQVEELQAMAARAGLEEVGIYGGYGGEPFTGWERLLVYHGRKA
ncbi:MAG TPA: class I SAM-dependent methyltransferase [Armatimonadota bacterium]|jgi:SAM-dependent methyltransferase